MYPDKQCLKPSCVAPSYASLNLPAVCTYSSVTANIPFFEKGSGKSYQEAIDISSQAKKIVSYDGKYEGFSITLPKDQLIDFNLAPIKNGDIGLTLFDPLSFHQNISADNWIFGKGKLAIERIEDGNNYVYKVWQVDSNDKTPYVVSVNLCDKFGKTVYNCVQQDKIPSPPSISEDRSAEIAPAPRAKPAPALIPIIPPEVPTDSPPPTTTTPKGPVVNVPTVLEQLPAPRVVTDKNSPKNDQTSPKPDMPPPQIDSGPELPSPQPSPVVASAVQVASDLLVNKLEALNGSLRDGIEYVQIDKNAPHHKMSITKKGNQLILQVEDRREEGRIIRDTAVFTKTSEGWQVRWTYNSEDGTEIPATAKEIAKALVERKGFNDNEFLDRGRLFRRIEMLLSNPPIPTNDVSSIPSVWAKVNPDFCAMLNTLQDKLEAQTVYYHNVHQHRMEICRDGDGTITLSVSNRRDDGTLEEDKAIFRKQGDHWEVTWSEKIGDKMIPVPIDEICLSTQKQTGLNPGNSFLDGGRLFRRVNILLNYPLDIY